jgi:hypothetical protein
MTRPGALCDFNWRALGVVAAELVVQDYVKQGLMHVDATIVLDKSELAEAIHKETHAGARGADHFS